MYTAPFRANENEVHANMTAKKCRGMISFIWPVLLGLQPYCRPLDDAFLQIALLANHFQIKWKGVNVHETNAHRTDDIRELETTALEFGKLLAKPLGLRVSTKMQRTMHHVGDHVRLNGCTRRGDTDRNATFHKQTKTA